MLYEVITVMNDDGLPKLRISKFYREAVATGKKIPKETKTYLSYNFV